MIYENDCRESCPSGLSFAYNLFKDIIIFLINAQNAQKLAYHVIIANVLSLIANLINMELKILKNAIIVLKAVKNAMGLMIMTAYLAIAIFI